MMVPGFRLVFVGLLGLLLALSSPVRAGGSLTVLMYHRFDAGVNISIPMESFRRQINYLIENDYNFVGLSGVREHLRSGKPFPERSVMITVDDGYRSTYTKAFPFLESRGIPWVLYVYTEALQKEFPSSMTWNQVREIARSGVPVGNHSYSHSHMIRTRNKTDTWVRREILSPHETLASRLGREPVSFAIPYGEYDRELIEVLRTQMDYDLVWGIDPGVVDPGNPGPVLHRFGINRSTSWEEFKKKINRLPLRTRDPYPRRGQRLTVSPDTVAITLERFDRLKEGPINLFVSEFGALDWSRGNQPGRIVAELPKPLSREWNRLIVTAFDSETGRYRYDSLGFVYEPALSDR